MVKVRAMVVPHAKLLAMLTINGAALEPVPPLPAMVPKLWVAFRIVTPAVAVVRVPVTGPPVEVQPSLPTVIVKALQELAVGVPTKLWLASDKSAGVVTPAFGTRAKRTSGLPKRLSPHWT